MKHGRGREKTKKRVGDMHTPYRTDRKDSREKEHLSKVPTVTYLKERESTSYAHGGKFQAKTTVNSRAQVTWKPPKCRRPFRMDEES